MREAFFHISKVIFSYLDTLFIQSQLIEIRTAHVVFQCFQISKINTINVQDFS